ncbi:MAG: DUF512 domain-containing protein [bacterium]|nr:DUF512 domain-containing protein [bacterium]
MSIENSFHFSDQSSPQTRGLTIYQVQPNSPADKEGIIPGDRILEINDKKIRDELDFKFYELESDLRIKILRDGKEQIVIIQKGAEESLGITLPPISIRQCRNKCVFCFVDQQPITMRKTLRVKDDDYRYSFLHGNFITLTNVADIELNRIIEEHLSPQYISVQVTDPYIHQKLLGLPKIDPIVPKLEKLIKGNIQLHTQIVVVPEWNDKEVLERSVLDLLDVLRDDCSIAIVPVGLTKYRNGLTPLRIPTPQEAQEVISLHFHWREISKNKIGKPIIYCADEWFHLAGFEVPEHSYYEDYVQYENGVGMLRKLEVNTMQERWKWIKRLPRPYHWLWITGKSASYWLKEKIVPLLTQEISPLTIEVLEVENTFWGSTVTVANLLTGQDIWQAIEKIKTNADLIILPPDVVNGDGLFLDDWSLEDLQSAVVKPQVIPFPNQFAPLIRKTLTIK